MVIPKFVYKQIGDRQYYNIDEKRKTELIDLNEAEKARPQDKKCPRLLNGDKEKHRNMQKYGIFLFLAKLGEFLSPNDAEYNTWFLNVWLSIWFNVISICIKILPVGHQNLHWNVFSLSKTQRTLIEMNVNRSEKKETERTYYAFQINKWEGCN